MSSKKKFGLDKDEFEDIVSRIGRDKFQRILDRGTEIVSKALEDIPADAKPSARLHSVSQAWGNLMTAVKIAAEVQKLRATDVGIQKLAVEMDIARASQTNSVSLADLNKARDAALKNSGATPPTLPTVGPINDEEVDDK